jgi:hypothetical protein
MISVDPEVDQIILLSSCHTIPAEFNASHQPLNAFAHDGTEQRYWTIRQKGRPLLFHVILVEEHFLFHCDFKEPRKK